MFFYELSGRSIFLAAAVHTYSSHICQMFDKVNNVIDKHSGETCLLWHFKSAIRISSSHDVERKSKQLWPAHARGKKCPFVKLGSVRAAKLATMLSTTVGPNEAIDAEFGTHNRN